MSKKNKILIIICAVILVILLSLAIIIPIIIKNNIEEEKKNILNNTNSLIMQIEEICKKEIATDDLIPTYKYEINDKKFVQEIKVTGELPDNGIIELDKECIITLSINYGEYSVVKKADGKAEIVNHSIYENGSVIYFNPIEYKVCDDYKEENSNDGVKEGCMKWYTFNDTKNSSKVSLILDHNTTSSVRWVTSKDYDNATEDKEYSNDEGALTAKNKLNADTASWYSLSGPIARLITIKEISKIMNTNIDLGSKDNYFFESKLSKPLKSCYKDDISNCSYGWLYDHTAINCKDYGCLNNSQSETYGYWTDTASTSEKLEAWQVYFDGRIMTSNINEIGFGIRPVIEVQKTLLK